MISGTTLNMAGQLFIRDDDGYERICTAKRIEDITFAQNTDNSPYRLNFTQDFTMTLESKDFNAKRFWMLVYGLTTKRQQRLVIRHIKWWKKRLKKTGQGPTLPYDIIMASIMEVAGYIVRPKRRK